MLDCAYGGTGSWRGGDVVIQVQEKELLEVR